MPLIARLSICSVISPDEKVLPARLNMELIHHLQTIDAVDVFTPRAVYDGRKNLFAARELPIGPQNSQQACSFDVIQYLSFTPM
jgi:eukaryotic translation initiation factor 2C